MGSGPETGEEAEPPSQDENGEKDELAEYELDKYDEDTGAGEEQTEHDTSDKVQFANGRL